jgi:hypothetical protein
MAAEKIYFNVCKIKDENLLDNEKAIERFIKRSIMKNYAQVSFITNG